MIRRSSVPVHVLVLVLVQGCSAPQSGSSSGGGGGPAPVARNCELKAVWELTISNVGDACGTAAPRAGDSRATAATLKFRTTGTGAVINMEPPYRGFKMIKSTADCRFTLQASKNDGAPDWAEFTLAVGDNGIVSGTGHTDVAMSSGAICSVPHEVTGTKR